MGLEKASMGEHSYASFLICGASGTGKSTVAAKFPKPFIALLEPNGRESIARVNKDQPVWICRCLGDVRNAIEYFKANIKNFETFVLDSGTELDQFVVDEVLGEKKDFLEIQDYRLVESKTKAIINQLRSLPANTVVIYLVAEKENHKRVFTYRVIASGAQWACKIPSMFNYVWRATKAPVIQDGKVTGMQFMLETRSTDDIELKDHPDLTQYIPAEPRKWMRIVLPERYGKKSETKENNQ